MRRERIGQALLIVAALINIAPSLGAISLDLARSTYGVEIAGADMETLFRHRAILLGIVGTTLAVAAFRPRLRAAAITMNAVSFGSFVLCGLIGGPVNPELTRVAWIDVVGLGVLAAFAATKTQRVVHDS
ncbi:hypothetical protein NLX83_28395 [Allokutzneria sp. A3M-2-11 16]|uniref:hypothetical protein n=1 Tax=Allokutzneria sp. A3M-2-11 16 TaxID=2962043 RepID=UPI0020B69E3A|nr:hypothetical protein [Allokutzneria sp. A3M-2-11 16]MCP3803205.1 hypothetical protein [Allokutzneria sp. A3M-2-11 16]